ncbi:MAG TPA: hypothetical protein VEK33_26170 [Terriglobales bacterium]|nr:hypothetical protein [Terriglobales bacterium]
MKCLCFTLLLLGMTSAVSAQRPLVTPETAIDSSTLHQWLHSGDPRLIAWAADFARRAHNAEIVAEMPALLEHWAIPQAIGDGDSQAAQRRAVTAILDTLIQENVQVPIPAIAAVAELFPAQAAILIGRLPLSESRVTLQDWTYGETGTWTGRTLARIASMMLAKDPGPSRVFFNRDLGDVGFVASIVAASEEELQIMVAAAKTEHEGTGGGSCGDSFGRKLAPGWPQVYSYGLEENDPQVSAPVVVDLDGDRIVSIRAKENGGWGSCYGVQWPDPSTRHRLIAHWLGVTDKEMSWQPVEGFTIVWTNKTEYQRQLGEITEVQREKLHATVDALRQRGLLTEREAATVTPRLIVTVQCEIKPCPLI